MKKVRLLSYQIKKLIHLPETGMGYQIVDINLKSGEVKNDITVLNSEFLQLEDGQNINPKDITHIELKNKTP